MSDFEQVSVYGPDGSVRSGFPARRTGEAGYGWGMYNQNVTIGDLDDDGQREIYAPTDTHYITALHPNGDQLAANAMYGAGKVWSEVGVHVDHEADLQGYADCGIHHRPNWANSAPVIADMDGDGTDELVVVGDVYDCSVGDPEGDLYHTPWILNMDRTRWSGSGYDWMTLPASNSGPLPNAQDWNVIQYCVTSTVVADLDNDGHKEILYPSYDGRLHVYWLDGTAHGSWPFVVPGSGMNFASEPAVVDIEGDGPAEVIFTSWPENGGSRNGKLYILDSTGVELHSVDLPDPMNSDWNGALGAPTIANIDDDPDMEIVIGTVSSGVVAYDLPGSEDARIHWGTSRGGLLRSGNADDPGTVSGSGGSGSGGGSGVGGAGTGNSGVGASGVGPSDSSDDGCGCGVPGGSPRAPWASLVLLLPLLCRRRAGARVARRAQ